MSARNVCESWESSCRSQPPPPARTCPPASTALLAISGQIPVTPGAAPHRPLRRRRDRRGGLRDERRGTSARAGHRGVPEPAAPAPRVVRARPPPRRPAGERNYLRPDSPVRRSPSPIAEIDGGAWQARGEPLPTGHCGVDVACPSRRATPSRAGAPSTGSPRRAPPSARSRPHHRRRAGRRLRRRVRPPDFTQHPAVVNGASDLLVEVFGDAGRHARAAVKGPVWPPCPWASPVEVEFLFAVAVPRSSREALRQACYFGTTPEFWPEPPAYPRSEIESGDEINVSSRRGRWGWACAPSGSAG